MAEHGFGNWYGDTSSVAVPAGFDHLQALRIVGYDLKDSIAVISAFKRHWMQDTLAAVLNEADLKILYSLSKTYQ